MTNENEKSPIQKVVDEMMKRLVARSKACSDNLELAVRGGRSLESVKIQGYITGVMDAAVKLSSFPEGCITNLTIEETRLEGEIGTSSDVNAVLFTHGKQRAIQHVIQELQELIVDTMQVKDPEPEPEEGDEDPRSYLEDEDGNRTYLDSNDQEEAEDQVQAAKPAEPGEPGQKRVLASGQVRSEDVLEWAYHWGDDKTGVDIPVSDAAEYFWHNEKRSASRARAVCHNFLYLMAAKGAIRYTKEGRYIKTFQLMPDWRQRCRRSPKKLDIHVANIPHFRKEGASKVAFVSESGAKVDQETEKAIAELDMDALAKAVREVKDGEEG